MNILLITRVWPAHRPGGMPHVAYDRAKALVQAGHSVVVVTTSISRMPRNHSDPCQVAYLGGTAPAAWSKDFTIKVRQYAEEKSGFWDIIHSDSFDRENPWFVGWRGAPIQAVTMHGPKWGTWLTHRNLAAIRQRGAADFPAQEIMEEQNALAHADRVLAISQWEHRMLRDHYRLPQTKPVYNPIGHMFFSLGSRKRTYFLSAAITGQRERVFTAAQEACEAAGVEWREVRNVPREQMPALYAGAIALVNPTCYAQGYDLTVAEGRAQGCPAILGATGSYLDEADPRWDILVEPGNAADVVAAVKEKLARGDDDHARYVMRELSLYLHSPDNHAVNWIDALK